jgi:glycogen debranching enzyme
MHFEHNRLPELFTGFSHSDYDVPIRFPVACHPQAWAAGSVPYLLQALLGLQADGFSDRLNVVRPMLPHDVDRLEIRKLPLAGSHVSLRFTRTEDGACAVETVESGEIEVVVEPG